MPEGRAQTVFIDAIGTSPRGETVVAFTSPCQRIEHGFLRHMTRRQAVDLLQRNAALPFAAFCVLSRDKTDMLCVRSTLLLETIDPEEFRASCECVGKFADEYEAELGKDEF